MVYDLLLILYSEAKKTCGQQHFPVKQPITSKISNDWYGNIFFWAVESNFRLQIQNLLPLYIF